MESGKPSASSPRTRRPEAVFSADIRVAIAWHVSCFQQAGAEQPVERQRIGRDEEEGTAMTLEATLTYLVALAVPLWLLIEYLVSRRRSRPAEPSQRGHREPAERGSLKAASPEAPEPSIARDLRRKAA